MPKSSIGIASAALLAVLAAAWFMYGGAFIPGSVSQTLREGSTAEQATPGTASSTIEAAFSCPSGQNIAAVFDNTAGTVRLSLSDGRSMELPRALSADGARYANADESFVFWNKGRGAFITENGTTTFLDCVESGSRMY